MNINKYIKWDEIWAEQVDVIAHIFSFLEKCDIL